MNNGGEYLPRTFWLKVFWKHLWYGSTQSIFTGVSTTVNICDEEFFITVFNKKPLDQDD